MQLFSCHFTFLSTTKTFAKFAKHAGKSGTKYTHSEHTDVNKKTHVQMMTKGCVVRGRSLSGTATELRRRWMFIQMICSATFDYFNY